MAIFDFFKRKTSETDVCVDEKMDEPKLSWAQRLKQKLTKSNVLFKKLFNVFSESEVDYDQLEEVLLNLDIDYELTSHFIDKIKCQDKWDKLTPDSARCLMKQLAMDILKPHSKQLNLEQYRTGDPIVLIFCGINGGGKTTSVAKIANLYKADYKPLMVACDCFRAAAREQLESWARRTEVDIFFGDSSGEKITDAASVAYKSIEYAKEYGHDLVLIDTSGRLHNNANLMSELQKIDRVLKKHNPEYAQEVILVLDGTMGQNLKDQIENFDKTIKITGLIVTKLDGIARGGIILTLVHKYKIPVYFIGIGEKDTDINHFNPEEFVDSLFCD